MLEINYVQSGNHVQVTKIKAMSKKQIRRRLTKEQFTEWEKGLHCYRKRCYDDVDVEILDKDGKHTGKYKTKYIPYTSLVIKFGCSYVDDLNTYTPSMSYSPSVEKFTRMIEQIKICGDNLSKVIKNEPIVESKTFSY